MNHDKNMKTLGEELPKEQIRVRKLIEIYKDIGPAGRFAILSMENDLKYAGEVIISGDIEGMITAYELLKGYTE